ncbi:MAG: hypothetical protein LKF99_01140 [Bifidobacterium sp.]|nr:hypothetical protein [Bifidobacterium sp.]
MPPQQFQAQPPMQQPPIGAPYQQGPVGKGTSGMSVTALVLGVLGLVLSWIPIVNNVAAVLGFIGLVFGLISIFTTGAKHKKKGRGLAIAGSILCVIALIVTFAIQASASKALKDVATQAGSAQSSSTAKESSSSDSTKSTSSNAQVVLEATATGKGTVIWGEAGSTNTEDFNGQWSKTISGDDAKKGYTISVTGDFMGASDQKVSCTVTVNGQQKSHKEGSGTSGSAMCDTYGIFN